MALDVPVAILVFNRPDLTARVLEAISIARPRKLMVVADGPRTAEESSKTNAVRALISRLNWDCEVLCNFSDVNLGCKQRVSSGLDWIFEQCEEAIVIEDDCVPHPTFFPYCGELLAKYRNDERVMMIGGTNFRSVQYKSPFSYYFSKSINVWGWASWRRAWRHYDVQMSLWPTLSRTTWLADLFGDEEVAQWWHWAFAETYANRINTWDFQWAFACWVQSGLGVLPEVNLVSNIGFGTDGTHTAMMDSAIATSALEVIEFPLNPPPYMLPDIRADARTFRKLGCVAAKDDAVPIQSRLRHRARLLAGSLLNRSNTEK